MLVGSNALFAAPPTPRPSPPAAIANESVATKSRELVPVTIKLEGDLGMLNPVARIKINGRDVGMLLPGEKKTVYIAAGRVLFSIGTGSQERRFTETIIPGERQNYRIELNANNKFHLSRAGSSNR